MTIELVLAILALGSALLTAGRLMFRTEALGETHALALLDCRRRCEALELAIGDSKISHSALAERVGHCSASIEHKASVESVASVRESVEGLRREVMGPLCSQLDRIERKLDDEKRTK